MKNAALMVSALFLVVSVTGCKSDMEKAADEICACAEKKGDDAKKCLDEASKKMPAKSENKQLKDMSAKDQEAMGKAMACSMKMMDNK